MPSVSTHPPTTQRLAHEMKFTEGSIEGLWIVDIEPIEDHRGFFARTWCEDEFGERGLSAIWRQSNTQVSPHRGTMRGLHYQFPPHTEVKLVRCTRGAVFDVAVDLRPGSPTFMQWSGVELSGENRRSVWTPAGCAHGYLTLEPETEAGYLTSYQYTPSAVRGLRYDDPAFQITWPEDPTELPPGYETWPSFDRLDPHFWPQAEGTGQLG